VNAPIVPDCVSTFLSAKKGEYVKFLVAEQADTSNNNNNNNNRYRIPDILAKVGDGGGNRSCVKDVIDSRRIERVYHRHIGDQQSLIEI